MKTSFLFLASIFALSTLSSRADESFSRYDSNKDGAVEYRELAMAKKSTEFDKMDRNRDKTVSTEEFAAVPIEKSGDWDFFVTPEFSVIDGDKNGKVTLVEFGATVKSLIQRVDASGDAKVTTEEYAAAVQKGKVAAASKMVPKGSGPKGSAPKGKGTTPPKKK